MIFNHQTEQNIIGSILHLNGYGEHAANAIDSLTSNDFYSANHKKVFSAMVELHARDIRPNLMSLLEHHSVFDDDDTYRYIADVAHRTTSALNLSHHVISLKKLSELRETQNRINEVNSIIASSDDIDSKLADIEKLFSYEFGSTTNEVGAKHISDCIGNYVDYLQKRWESPEDVIFTTGIPDLDEVFGGGLEVGLHAIAARPKMGKTELMTKMINHFAIDKQLPIYVGSLEMPDDQMMHRLSSSLSQVGKDQIKKGFNCKDYEENVSYSVFKKALKDLSETNTYIDTRHNNSVKKIRRECLKIQKKHGRVGGIFVDYLGLLDSDEKHDRHDLAIGSMTRAFKGMSKEFECPVIMLLQLNRGLESRPDKRPMPSDSRDSGSIEQDVDSWTAIYRDSVYNEDSPWQMITEIIVRLNRHGGTGTCYQVLASDGFKNADQYKVAELIHKEETKAKDKASSVDEF